MPYMVGAPLRCIPGGCLVVSPPPDPQVASGATMGKYPYPVKVIILAGGFGTRLAEETDKVPKPMVTIGGRPILWHIMASFAAQGYKDFVVAAGYRSEVIRTWVANLSLLEGRELHRPARGGPRISTGADSDSWDITVLETGLLTSTGGRVRLAMDHIGPERCIVTYGDGLSDVALDRVVQRHVALGTTLTLTAVSPPARFGRVRHTEGVVDYFGEKVPNSEELISGGFFVAEPELAGYLSVDEALEGTPMARLVDDKRLGAYVHGGFWHSMDTVRDRAILEDLWNSGSPPWLRKPDAGEAD